METFIYALIWNSLVAFWIILTIWFTKFIKNKLVNYINYIIAITVWLLFWIIFIWFIPELVDWWIKWYDLWLFLLFWLWVFYIFELFIHWHHCNDLLHKKHSCQYNNSHNHKNWLLMFFSTFLHNSFHWIILFWAFWINIIFWITTTFAILLHSIPQNIVNYIMNHDKEHYSYVAAFGWIFWALITYPFINILIQNKANILAFITWCLLYTALADILPEFKKDWEFKIKLIYLWLIISWILLFIIFQKII